jgi:hypothetical protein
MARSVFDAAISVFRTIFSRRKTCSGASLILMPSLNVGRSPSQQECSRSGRRDSGADQGPLGAFAKSAVIRHGSPPLGGR